MAMKSYRVNREHQGDRDYARGDLRKANEGDVKHLVEMGVLTLLGDAPKKRLAKTAKVAQAHKVKPAPLLGRKSDSDTK